MRTINTAVITGPTGAIGTALSSLLLAKGIIVYAVVRPDSDRKQHLQEIEGIHIIEADVSKLNDLPSLISHADVFFHLAWGKTTGQGRNDMDAQIRNIQYTVEACRVAGVLGCKVFIGAGSQAEYGRVIHALTPETPCFPENGYGMAKLCAGMMSRTECERLRIEHIWPRIVSVYGPHDGENAMIPQVIKKILAGEKPSLTAGEQIWDYLYADDAARAMYLLALYGKDRGIYPIGSGVARPLKEYIEMLRDSIAPDKPLGFGEIAYSEKQVMYLKADISTLHKDTGFVPETDFRNGIQKTIDYVRRQMNG